MQRFVRPISSPMSSLHLIKEFLLDRIGVTQCASQRMSIDLRVKRENNPTSVAVLQLQVVALPVNLYKPKALESRVDLPPGQERQPHDNSTTSHSSPKAS